ncbi:SgcJ/EcaC family oxidoreductase [Euhalothece natronophila Z-M001]|uniref:SgcJ/EcaC family oxidoreductase n=1 Tax=Euhalothece natronophila Z-M001 TaxID=522448 RepID=A0A5B8NS51_9CHRO|nr:SgcJ/EcaC family oxidoreductase [Euhalothece natronophila]QDZ41075.1 SgcJ/EcaC family oxidoreductase [Euhalothece natronophila Z-M001]
MKKIITLSVSFLAATLVGYVSHGVAETNNTNNEETREETCKATSEEEIASLFERWNESLETGEPSKVADNYAEESTLLPTVSNQPRLTREEKKDYFDDFLEESPSGEINFRNIKIHCNTAVDAGIYTFTFADTGEIVTARYSYTYQWDGSEWLIVSHHSSELPE